MIVAGLRLSEPRATAILGETGAVAWAPEGVGIEALKVDRVVVDGPLGLAWESDGRKGERAVGSYVRTPDVVPEAGSRPFADLIRRSLVGAGATRRPEADLFETRPALAWRALVGADLPSASLESGRQARARALEKAGLRLPTGSQPTNAQLDAALCALLGVLHEADRADFVGAPAFQDVGGLWREGRILMPRAEAAVATGTRVVADWVCLANEPRSGRFETYRLAVEEGVIPRALFTTGARKTPLENVTRLRAGQSLLLAQSGRGGPRALGLFRVSDGAVVRHPNPRGRPWTFAGFTRVYEPALVARMEAAGGERDPLLEVHVGLAVALVRDVQDAEVALKRGMEAGALAPWGEVVR